MTIVSRLPSKLHSLPPLSLLIHPSPLRLAGELQALLRVCPGHAVSVSRELAQVLCRVPPARWSLATRECLEQIMAAGDAELVLCADLALLFEPALAVDPLALLRQCAVNVKLMVLWPGSYQDGVLAYGTPGHAHYRTWPNPDAHVIPLR